jgi:two-component system phosphate regulon response regulator PhoB
LKRAEKTAASTPKVLVVEDETDIRELIELHLGRERYEVDAVADGEEALKRLASESYDLLILDWMLPALSGLEITRNVRSRKTGHRVPILMVTARMEPTDIVLGLEAGADDYVTKPFEIPVLMARVRALLRRSQIEKGTQPAAPTEWIEVGGLKLDPQSYQVTCQGQPVQLTLSEFKLLLSLAQNKGRVLTRDRLIDLIQGEGVTVVDRAIDTHVFGLRKKLGACSEVVETVRGVGYRIKSE